MALADLLTEPLVILSYADTVNEYGNEVRAEDPDETEVLGRIEQDRAAETTNQRDAQVADWTAYLPPGTEVDGRMQLRRESDGQLFEFVGPPDRVRSPAGEHHVAARARSVDG